jgi:hypothetical protein
VLAATLVRDRAGQFTEAFEPARAFRLAGMPTFPCSVPVNGDAGDEKKQTVMNDAIETGR